MKLLKQSLDWAIVGLNKHVTHTWSAKRRRRWLIKTIEPLPVHLGDYGVIKIFYYKKECGEREIIVCLSLKETIVGVAINPLENPPSFLPGDRCWSVCPHTHTPALHFSEKSTKLDEDDRILENVFFSPQEKRGGESLSLLLLLIRLDYIFLKKEDEKVAKAPFLLGKDSQNRELYRSHAAFLYTTAWWENKFQHLHDYLEMDWGEKNQNIFKMFRLTLSKLRNMPR